MPTFRSFILLGLLASVPVLAAQEAPAAEGSAPKVSRTPLVLRQGGTPEAPAVHDGKGVVIDLGIDVTAHPWRTDGDLWQATARLAEWEPVAPGMLTGLFIDERPLLIAIDKEAQAKREKGDTKNRYLPPAALAPGQMGCTAEGLVYFRWPAGRAPGSATLYIPPKPATSCVSIQCSHIIVRNLTVRHAANDGINIHGDQRGIRLENIRALSCVDEGISAHETVEMQVSDCEIAWNASQDGGVVDVDNSTTTYDRCTVHDNLVGTGAAFKFAGGTHRVTNTVIYHQKIDFRVTAGTVFSKEGVTFKEPVAP